MDVIFPDYYDNFAEFEHESKGYLCGVLAKVTGQTFEYDFYNKDRLRQYVEDELVDEYSYLRLNSIVVVNRVARSTMIDVLTKMHSG